MRSNTLKTFAAGVVAGGTLFISYGVISQDYGGQSQEELFKMFEELAKPGPQHAQLARYAGTWKQVVKSWNWMDPSQQAEPDVSESTAEYKTILGGRFVTETTRGQMQWGGQTHDFEGFGVFGYDNQKQKHFYLWFDNMGTTYLLGEGDADPSGKVVTYFSECPDPMGSGTMKFKSVSRTISDDENYFEMYLDTGDGKWSKNLEIHQTRAGRAPASKTPAGGR